MKCSYCNNEAKYSAWVYDNDPYEVFLCVQDDSICHLDEINNELDNKQRGMCNLSCLDDRLEKPVYSFRYDTYHEGWFAYCSHFYRQCNEYAQESKEEALNDMLLGFYDAYKHNGIRPNIISPGYAKNKIKSYALSKKDAKDKLTRLRNIISELIDCKDDIIRARLYNEFKGLIDSPYIAMPNNIIIYSQIINDPDYKE